MCFLIMQPFFTIDLFGCLLPLHCSVYYCHVSCLPLLCCFVHLLLSYCILIYVCTYIQYVCTYCMYVHTGRIPTIVVCVHPPLLLYHPHSPHSFIHYCAHTYVCTYVNMCLYVHTCVCCMCVHTRQCCCTTLTLIVPSSTSVHIHTYVDRRGQTGGPRGCRVPEEPKEISDTWG